MAGGLDNDPRSFYNPRMSLHQCPKCEGKTFVVEVNRDYLQKCGCGFTKYLLRRHSDGTVSIYNTPARTTKIVPKKNTKLYSCLLQLVVGHPEGMSTFAVSEAARLVKGDVASMLIVLMNKNLVERVRVGKGVQGGSIWRL